MPLDQLAGSPPGTPATKAGTAGSTHTITFGTTPAVGSLIVVSVSIFSSLSPVQDVVSVVDNQGNGTYDMLFQPPGTGLACAVYICSKIATNASGTFTITLTFNSTDTTTYIVMGAASFTTVTTGTVERSAGNITTLGATSLSVSTAATTTPTSLVVAVIHPTANDANINLVQTVANYQTAFVEQNSSVAAGHMFNWQEVTLTGVATGTWTFDAASAAALVATWPEEAEAPPPVTPFVSMQIRKAP